MKNECSIVHDLLPLYFENMLSEDTSEFVKDHLKNCLGCTTEFDIMKAGKQIDEAAVQQREHDVNVINGLKNKIRKKRCISISIAAACLLAVIVLLHHFPVYQIAKVGDTSFFSSGEIAKLVCIGSKSDRAEVQSILRQADAAFHDCNHTSAENAEKYGVLSRYASATDLYNDVSFTNYSLELLSAHLGSTDGYLWVYYSLEAFDSEGHTVTGSKNIPSLWEVEKESTGTWSVVQIKEHP